jgi:hypothetical protein
MTPALAALHLGLILARVVEGRVVDPVGRPVAAVVDAACGDEWREVPVDRSGWFSIPTSDGATCDLTVRGEGFPAVRLRDVLPGAPPRRVVVSPVTG